MKIIRQTGKIVGLGLILSGLLVLVGRYGPVHVTEQYYAYVGVLASGLILVFPVGELIGLYLKSKAPTGYQSSGIEEAGKVIGWLERTIVLAFYLGGSLSGIGFLVVAKSIYRFGDLRRGSEAENNGDEERRDTFSISEYIILGSLLSYTSAILGGMIIELVLTQLGLNLELIP